MNSPTLILHQSSRGHTVGAITVQLRAEVHYPAGGAGPDFASCVAAKISAVLSRKLKTVGEIKRESSIAGRSAGRRPSSSPTRNNELESNEILTPVGERDAELVDAIRQKMFVFDDLLSIDANGVKELLARADRKQLTVALKGASEELRKHLLQGMSQRGSTMLLEDMEALGPVKLRDVEAAQQEMIALLRTLESEGVVSLKGGTNEQYV